MIVSLFHCTVPLIPISICQTRALSCEFFVPVIPPATTVVGADFTWLKFLNMAAALDNNLIPAFHQNDDQALRIIVREHFPAMIAYARQLINEEDEANEIAVNTFIKLIAMRRNFRTLADIKAFLLITVRNACYDYLSCEVHDKPSKNEMLTLEELFHGAAGATTVMITSDGLLKLYEGINKLTGRCAEIFKLYFYNKMATSEIARQLSIPVKIVRSQKSRALKIIRGCLAANLTITLSLN